MCSKSEKYYNEIYDPIGKDSVADANKVHKFIQKRKHTDGNTLLDVACGTGARAGPLRQYSKVEGLDLDATMLKVAHKKYRKISFHHGDMTNFDLGRQFDAVVCLFSSIGYVKTKANLQKAIKNIVRHLLSGGDCFLIEPWFAPEQWKVGPVPTLHVHKTDLKITCMSRSGQRGKVSLLEFQYLVGTPKGIEHRIEYHELGLFTHEEYWVEFPSAGLKVLPNKHGLDGRGLYIGKKISQIKP